MATDLMAPASIGVTGASGFVGRHLLAHLAARGHRVLALARTASAPPQPHAHATKMVDYADRVALAAAFEGLDAVVHLAARAHVLTKEDAQTAQQAFRDANVEVALAAADAARQAGCQRFVLVSSIGVNGNATHGQPFTESSPAQPLEAYAQSKWQAELAVKDLLAGSATELCIVRPPLVYGPGCPGNFRALLKLVQRLPVLPFAQLRARRSYIGVHNLCSALEYAALHAACANQLFLLSDGDDIALSRLIDVLASAMGRQSPRWGVPPWLLRGAATAVGRAATFDKLAGELLVDSQHFRDATGWVPPTPLALGLAQTAQACVNHPPGA